MLFSFNKLQRMANLPAEVTVEDVAKAINSIGFEVEEYNKFIDVEGVKFGRVLEITKNPNADKLNVCRIEFDDKERTIQTNATNVEVGMTLIAFVPGSRVGDMVFQAKELKGIVSEGMLSAPSEFGIAKDLIRPEHVEGITRYDGVRDLSKDPIEYLGLNDYIIDVTILSNRSDANSYYVMAMELAAYFGTEVYLPRLIEGNKNASIKVSSEGSKSLVMIEAEKDFKISIKDQLFLAKHGVKSINDIVDLTNLTLLMTGQPTHAYDKGKVGTEFKAGKYTGKIAVFGNKEVELKDDLVILSDNKPVSVAGVIGMDATGVSADTKDFIIELGRFNIKEVRKAVKAVKLNTDASNQSSKEIAVGTTELAVRFLSNILRTFTSPINMVEINERRVDYDVKKTSMLAGHDLAKDEKYIQTVKALETIGFEFLEGNKVKVPSHRHDIEAQQDMNEEVFRFYGYDNFKPVAPKLSAFKVEKPQTINEKVATMGYQEVVTYSLISEELNKLNPFGFASDVKLETFVSKEREVIRNSQAVSLLGVIDYNQKRKINNISIFDLGMINDGIKTLALASTVKTFDQVKQDVINLLGVEVSFVRHDDKNLHPGVSAKIMYKGEMIGWIGKVHPRVSDVNAFIAEVKLPLVTLSPKFESYSNDPLKTRDITFELKHFEEIAPRIEEIKSLNVFRVDIIDTFKTNELNKVTVRITATDEVIKTLDTKFN